jgi:hypothetical protein
VLIIVIGLLGLKLYGAIFKHQEIFPKLDRDIVKKEKKKGASIDTRPGGGNFDIIKTKNLFNPARTASEEESVASTVSSKTPPKLFGTIILNNERTAILQDPDSKKTGNYHVNDKVAGFTISEIQEDKVILSSGSDKVTVRLREDKGIVPQKPKTVRKPVKRTTPRRRPTPRTGQSRRRPPQRKNIKPPPEEEKLLREAIESLQ